MPQEIRVLRCFKCKFYQTDIVKKVKKWQCKMCGVKQSVFNEFFRGLGAECRQKAQELNFNTNEKQTKVENELLDLIERDDLEIDFDNISKEELKQPNGQLKLSYVENKWTKFVEEPDENRCENFEMEPFNKLKRKYSSIPNDYQKSAKVSNSLASTYSKWNAYL